MYVQISILPNISYAFLIGASAFWRQIQMILPLSARLHCHWGELAALTPVVTEERGRCLGTSKWTTPASSDTGRRTLRHPAAPQWEWEWSGFICIPYWIVINSMVSSVLTRSELPRTLYWARTLYWVCVANRHTTMAEAIKVRSLFEIRDNLANLQ